MKINSKKTVAIAMAACITAASTGIYAASFNDISKHWAKSYIEKGKELGLISGYTDGSFKPQEKISRIQTIVMSARLLNLSQAEIDKLVVNHKGLLLQKKVPNWSIEGFSIALSKGIIDESTLDKLFDTNGAESLSSREEVAVYLTRAIGLEKEAKNKGSNITLPFKDSKNISEAAKAYVLVMNEKGIISGDDLGNFNPKSAITRAEMATVLSSSHDHVEKKKDDEIVNVNGTIQSLFTAGGKNYINVRDILGIEKNYEINNQSTLLIGGKVSTYNDLRAGQDVKLKVAVNSENVIGVVMSLDIQVIVEKHSGKIYDINDYTKTLTLEYQEGGVINRKLFTLDSNSEIILDEIKVSFSELRKYDDVKLEVANGKVVKIEAEANIRDVKGILKDVNLIDKTISVEDKNGNRRKYDLHKDVRVERDRRRVELDKLKKGDEVEIRVEDKKVLSIYARMIETKIEGTIKGKNIRVNKSEITILNTKTKREETYEIPNAAHIVLNGERVRLDQLELDYSVVITLEGEEIVSIEGRPTVIRNKRLGIISYIGRSYIEMTLDGGEKMSIILKDTLIKDETGRIISSSSLNEGDEILVIGEVYPGEIIAEEITRLKK